MCVCVCVCVYMYTCIYIYTHTYRERGEEGGEGGAEREIARKRVKYRGYSATLKEQRKMI